MNQAKETKENTCAFYASDYHFEMVSLPYISKKLENHDEIIILTENNLEETVKTIVSKINLKENKKEKILNLNWKNEDKEKIQKIEKSINENKNLTIFIKGKQTYINNIKKNIKKLEKEKNNLNIIDCYDIQEVGDDLEHIMSKYDKVLRTLGVKEIEKL